MKKITSVFLCIVLLCSCFGFALPAQGASDTKLVAITFDDGPSKYTEQLLDGLAQYGAKATFFMVGSNVKVYPETVKRMKKEGHQLATHTMNHANLAKLSVSAIQQEVFGVNDLLDELVGKGNYCLRPPYGSYNDTVKETVETPIICWSLDTEDWRSRNTQKVYEAILSQVKDGDIILLHDLYKTSVEGALKAIKELSGKGYVFVTVEQLLKRRGITPQNGTVYHSAPNKGITLPAVIAPVIAARQTVLGTKVIISKSGNDDTVYYTSDGNRPTREAQIYKAPYYAVDSASVKAIAVGESELSDISEYTVDLKYAPSKETLDKGYYHYRIPFLSYDTAFKVGMKA